MNEIALKSFFDNAEAGRKLRYLVLVENAIEREKLLLAIVNEADKRDAPLLVNRASMSISSHDCNIKLLVVHERIADRTAGMFVQAIHGLDLLDKYERGHESKARMRALIRGPM